MATAPYHPQDHAQLEELISVLRTATENKKKGAPFGVIHRAFELPTGRTVERWKFREHDYAKANLPVYARGLFTYLVIDSVSGAEKSEIAARGYDKFFNLGEADTKDWPNLAGKTKGPYELSVKENGCIILIAGLDDGTLLVCSKNSTGKGENSELSHSSWGEKWIERHLQAAGKTKEALAKALRQMNATAVAELCDDEFEEHVLPYDGDRAGLYLHGINLNLPNFVTYPSSLVHQFADEWGFKKADYIIKDTIQEVESYLKDAAETGTFNGRDTEGFVVRCQGKVRGAEEYSDYFFKYKFEEPYLLFRNWREITKASINGKVPKISKNKQFTLKYLEFAMRKLDNDPALKAAYIHNHGIIAVRQEFLDTHNLTGMDVVRQEQGCDELEEAPAEVPKVSQRLAPKVVIVPVATIGCGKTTLSVALQHLFDWGHVQNDNVTSKKNRFNSFSSLIREQFQTHSVVIADRNNHQKRERHQIISQIPPYPGAYSFICLHYIHPREGKASIYASNWSRVNARGDEHQTIRAETDKGLVDSIMTGFLNRFEPVDESQGPDSEFSLVIDLDPRAETRTNLEVTVRELYSKYPSLLPRGMPSKEEMDKAMEVAFAYKPQVAPVSGFKNKTSAAPLSKSATGPSIPKVAMEYFAICLNKLEVTNLLARTFKTLPEDQRVIYNQLVESNRIQSSFHVTLIHRSAASSAGIKSAPENGGYWKTLLAVHRPYWEKLHQDPSNPPSQKSLEPSLGSARVQIERVVWTERLICLVARILPADESGTGAVRMPPQTEVDATNVDAPGREVKIRSVNRVAHITIGTVSPAVKPRESNDVLARWLDEEPEPEGGRRWEAAVSGDVILQGSVRGVLQKFGR